MKTIELLRNIEKELESSEIMHSKNEWSGADVIITNSERKKVNKGFYPEQRYIITNFSLELSWVFENIRDAFYAESLIDGCSKIELFGRLANAANRFIYKNTNISARNLCAAVLHEAFSIYEEMQEGIFQELPIAIGNEIADDYIDEAERTGFIGINDTIAFFKSHGVDINRA